MSKIDDLKTQIAINEDKYRRVTDKLKEVVDNPEKKTRIIDKLEKIKEKVDLQKEQLLKLQTTDSGKTQNPITRALIRFWNWITGAKKK